MAHQFKPIFDSLKLDCSVIREEEISNGLILDVQLHGKTTIQQFLRKLPDLQFRLQIEQPFSHELLPKAGIIRLQSIGVNKNVHFLNKTFELGSTNFFLGVDPTSNEIWTDMSENPHLLIAGSTGAGKSTAMHCLIGNALLSGFNSFLIDPKRVEFPYYEEIPNVQAVAYDVEGAENIFRHLIKMMDDRYIQLQKHRMLHMKDWAPMAQVFVFIDEIVDLLLQDSSNELKSMLIYLTQKSRAAGIYFVAATQRPSADILDSAIKSNFPARVACKTASRVDSRIILDEGGAEHLLGRGDALIKNHEHSSQRFQFPNVGPNQIIEKVMNQSW